MTTAETASSSVVHSVPQMSGDRDVLTLEEREKGLNEAIQWLRDELSSLKTQDQSLMRQFLALRSEINTLKDDMPTSTIDRSQTIDFRSPRQSDSDDVFFANDPRKRINSDPSIQNKSYSSGSDDEKL